ncbi:MAG: O-methyltransferase [Rickettsiales bacterium]|jgi:predicted O-methyltransferase YrrM
MSRNLATPSIDYIRSLYAAQDDLLISISAELEKRKLAIHVGAEEGRLLQLLIALHSAKTIVEIGTLAGYSTIWMARALPEDGHIYTINRDPSHIKMAESFFTQCECRERITQLSGDAHEVLPTLSNQAPFDMIFIDADKISYPDYLDWAEKNIRKNGLIIADNTLLKGLVTQTTPPENCAPTTWRNMRLFNERLADKSKYNATMIPTKEGLSVAIKLF